MLIFYFIDYLWSPLQITGVSMASYIKGRDGVKSNLSIDTRVTLHFEGNGGKMDTYDMVPYDLWMLLIQYSMVRISIGYYQRVVMLYVRDCSNISWHILNIEKQWIKHRYLSNLWQGTMLYLLFFNASNVSADFWTALVHLCFI